MTTKATARSGVTTRSAKRSAVRSPRSAASTYGRALRSSHSSAPPAISAVLIQTAPISCSPPQTSSATTLAPDANDASAPTTPSRPTPRPSRAASRVAGARRRGLPDRGPGRLRALAERPRATAAGARLVAARPRQRSGRARRRCGLDLEAGLSGLARALVAACSASARGLPGCRLRPDLSARALRRALRSAFAARFSLSARASMRLRALSLASSRSLVARACQRRPRGPSSSPAAAPCGLSLRLRNGIMPLL